MQVIELIFAHSLKARYFSRNYLGLDHPNFQRFLIAIFFPCTLSSCVYKMKMTFDIDTNVPK